jgi:hypothetical protein
VPQPQRIALNASAHKPPRNNLNAAPASAGVNRALPPTLSTRDSSQYVSGFETGISEPLPISRSSRAEMDLTDH